MRQVISGEILSGGGRSDSHTMHGLIKTDISIHGIDAGSPTASEV